MHLLFFAAYYYPHRGGYEKYIEEVSLGLVSRGWRVTIITCNTEHSDVQETKDGITILRLPSWNILGGTYPIPKISRELFCIQKYIRSQSVDIINSHTRFFLTSLLGWFVARLTHKHYVHVEHGTNFVFLSNQFTRSLAWLYDQTLGRIVISQADQLVGISQASLKFAHKLGGKEGVVIFNGVDTNFFQPQNKSDKTENVVILFVGRLIAAKGVQDLLEAYKIIQRTHSGLVLRIIGTGNYESQLRKTAISTKSIQFLGSLNPTEVRNELNRASIVVNPSYGEGLPTVILEAGACALAVIATDVGGTAEIIKDHESGLLIKPHAVNDLVDRLLLLIQDPQLQVTLGMRLLKTVRQQFSWQTSSENYHQMLTKLVLNHD